MAVPPTLNDLIQPDSPDDVLQFLLTQLSSLGFPTTSWQSGGRVYTLLRAVSVAISDVITTVSEVTKGGLLGLSTGPWLTLLAKESYDVDRFQATSAIGVVRFTVAAGNGPYSISPNQLVIKDALTGLRYISDENGYTLGVGNTDVGMVAETTGAAYNIPVGSGITLVTPLPGVTATLVDLGLGTWLTAFGSDEETDQALRIRCRTKWATIGLQKTKDAYTYTVMNVQGVGTRVTKVYVDDSNPRGPGTVDIWIAGDAGPIPDIDKFLISDYMFGMKAITSDLQTENATGVNVTISATVAYEGSYLTALADAQENIRSLIQATPIGGTILRAQVIEGEIMRVPGVVNVVVPTVLIGGDSFDFNLAASQVAVFEAFDYVGVIV